MRSDIYELDTLSSDYRAIPAEAEKVADFIGLDKKSTMRLRLLAEEMICMLPQLLIYGKGKFQIEAEGRDVELHLSVTPYDMNASDRDKILSVSKSGKNAAAVGIIGKIVNAVEIMLADRAKIEKNDPYGYFSMGLAEYSDSTAWSLMNYRDSFDSNAQTEKQEAWDELEKSIIAKLADDVIVGVLNGKVDIIVKKKF
ncbi:hypothetical protein [uncultured Ruminococcus sp.]|uniref:hypothetical protein n=1 Tax=uncultured Ruminococcus sp. TaxID=165186 RepID=UPI0025E6B662|nr:hypothetical protein [uncultured Ruminococcus sp.]